MRKVSDGSSKLQFPFVLYYDQSGRSVAQPGMVQLNRNIFAVSVHNTGTTLVIVNDDTLQPGESKTFGGFWGMVFTGRIFLQFQTQSPPPGTVINLAFVTQLFYVPAPFEDPDNLNPILGL